MDKRPNRPPRTELTDPQQCARCLDFRPLLEFPLKRDAKFGIGATCLTCIASYPSNVRKAGQRHLRTAITRKTLAPFKRTKLTDPWPCNTCRKSKPLHDFYKDNGQKFGYMRQCKACMRQTPSWPTAEESRLNSFHQTLKKHGMTPESYWAMHAQQGGVCAICKQTERMARFGRPQALALDHCHTSGKVRALLCAHCNKGLGSFSDSPERMRAAADFVEAHRQDTFKTPQNAPGPTIAV